MSKPFRLAIVNSHPIQYFAPLYAYLNRDSGLDITALYCSDSSLRGEVDPGFKQPVKWDVDLLDGYRSVFLGERSKQRNPRGFWSLVCLEVWSEIRSGKYDGVLIHGYAFAAFVLAFLAAKSKGIPVYIRSETHLRLRRAGWRRRLRDGFLGWIYRGAEGFFSIGSVNKAYYAALGAPESKIFDVPYTVDNDRFIESARLSAEERTAIRSRYGLPVEGFVVLYASKFMPRKHPDDVIRAVANLRKLGLPVTLFMVGTGEMEQDLRDLAADLCADDIVFAGFINQAELPKVYAISDVFVLPSENEPWGLIVNEVMCAGLPVVVSAEVGCVTDLVKDGINGWTFPARNVAALSDALLDVVSDEERRAAMGRESLAIIREWNYERCRRGVLAAVRERRSR